MRHDINYYPGMTDLAITISCDNREIHNSCIEIGDISGAVNDPDVEKAYDISIEVSTYNCKYCGFQFFDNRTEELLHTIFRMGGEQSVREYLTKTVTGR